MGHLQCLEASVQHSQHPQCHVCIDVPHVRYSKVPMPRWIIRFCHADPQPKGDPGTVFGPLTKLRTIGCLH